MKNLPSKDPSRMPWLMPGIKLATLVLIVGTGTVLLLTVEGGALWDHARVSAQIEAFGPAAPLWFMLLFALAISFAVPATPLTLAGAALLDPVTAFVAIYAGAVLSASASFGLGRWLGRGFVAQVLEGSEHPVLERLRGWDEALGARGFAATLYLRLAHLPYFLPSYMAALSRIDARSYLLASALGALPNTFVFVFLGHTLRRVWASGDVGALVSWETPVALVLVVVSALTPWLWGRVARDPVGPVV